MILTGEQAKVYKHIVEKIKNNNETEAVYTKEFHSLGIDPGNLKSCLERLIEKKVIQITESARGLHSFRKFKVLLPVTYNIPQSDEDILKETLKEKAQGFVYLVHDPINNLLKIGWAEKSVEKRIGSLQTGNPNKLIIITSLKGSMKAERVLHKKFKAFHVRGEWFKYTEEIVNYLRDENNIFLIDELTK